MNNKLKIVLDTNVFLVSIASHFKYFWVYEKLQQGEYELYVSNEILTEYQEQITKKFGLLVADSSLDFLLLFPSVHLITPHYKWQLILHDHDDDKFVDCAIAANADYIITNDKHFQILKGIEFPKVNILTIEEFKQLLS
jgi:putative PIN family toxin of toxin-antitoxin system